MSNMANYKNMHILIELIPSEIMDKYQLEKITYKGYA